jgi:hypothetical protein
VDRSKLYPLVEVLFIVLCGSLCGAESWRDFVDFGQERIDFLKKYYEFKKGVPSKQGEELRSFYINQIFFHYPIANHPQFAIH